ncbi:Yip1-domain-containing protein [Violaceomyces palustris]|uniref:Yip1-domain-containing protein n=1 Tax=Violaceomyces palustris TaxID=1673888 RepID=A0ACD0P3U5_9BASI|nr:Yip1-domain-containing protein [Violaceomyces palustris]
MSAIFDSSTPYANPYGQQASASSSSSSSSAQNQKPNPPYHPTLEFYSSNPPPSSSTSASANHLNSFYSSSTSSSTAHHDHGYASGPNARASLEGNMSSSAGYAPGSAAHSMMNSQLGFWSAFGTGGFPDEPSLMEELGINLSHILDKSLTVLNPIHSYSPAHHKDAHMMDDADLAGPLLFCFAFGMMLLLAGKSQFGYIYGVALLGDLSIYLLLNMMSEGGIDAYRVASVLGYCLLPLCLLSAVSVFVTLNSFLGYIISPVFILWCATSASGIFVSILRLSDQRLLVAYPVGLFYACFALLSVF